METCCKPVEPCLAEDLILALIVRITFTRLHRLDTPAANVRLSFGQGVGAAGRLKHIERAANGTTDDSLLLFASFHFLPYPKLDLFSDGCGLNLCHVHGDGPHVAE